MLRIAAATALAVGLTVVASAESSAQQDRRGFATERLNRFINQRSIVVEPQGNGAGEAQQPGRRNPAARIAINPGGDQSSNENGNGRPPSFIAQPPGNGGNGNGQGQEGPRQDPPRQQIVIAPESNAPLGRQDQPVRIPQDRPQVVIPPQRPPLDEQPVFQQQPERQERPVVVAPQRPLLETPDRPIVLNPPRDDQQAAEPRIDQQQRPFIATPSNDPLDGVTPPDDGQGAPVFNLTPPVDQPADLAAQPGQPAPDGSVLEAWQVQFRLGNAGYRDVRFVDRDEAFYYVVASSRGDHPIDYALAIDIYTGDISAQQEISYYAAATPEYREPDYQPPQYDPPRYQFNFQPEPDYEPEQHYQAPQYDPPQYEAPQYQAPDNGYRRY